MQTGKIHTALQGRSNTNRLTYNTYIERERETGAPSPMKMSIARPRTGISTLARVSVRSNSTGCREPMPGDCRLFAWADGL